MSKVIALHVLLLLAIPQLAIATEPQSFWLNSGLNNRDLTISPTGDLLFTTIMTPDNRFSVIMMSHKIKGNWQELQVAPFSGEFADLEPMFDPSGEKLFFSSKRPRPDRAGEDWDIWVTTREKGGWSEPANLGPPVNSTGNEFYPSIASNGNLYFTAQREGGLGAEDIYRAVSEDGKYVACVPLGQGVNSKLYEFNAFVTPDESAIIFSSQGREGELGGGDLYISRRTDSGEFGPAELLPDGINSTSLDYCPFVWHDTLYFTSRRSRAWGLIESYHQLEKEIQAPGNGLGDIYSVPFNPSRDSGSKP